MRRALSLLLAVVALGACGGDDDKDIVIDPGDGGDYEPALDANDVVDVIDNPYLPLIVGSRWVYEGDGERVEVEVLAERRMVMGIEAVVVRDTVREDGEIVEDTHDWYTQDREGNVWYLGEEVQNFADGKLEDTDGSWEAGVDGALPGIVMLAHPEVDDAYRQEYWEGEAEDLGEVLRVGVSTKVRAGSYDDVVVTRDWNPLEPEVIEEKHYARGVGLIFEEHVRGEAGRIELVEVDLG
ncbi:MAG TPA: hypothetical protein VFU93_13270 [Acidimicrobiales bacterium]|nr:hypothetical protein [Acidimicrobiales bacterium]